jgi:hypothetical protein
MVFRSREPRAVSSMVEGEEGGCCWWHVLALRRNLFVLGVERSSQCCASAYRWLGGFHLAEALLVRVAGNRRSGLVTAGSLRLNGKSQGGLLLDRRW